MTEFKKWRKPRRSGGQNDACVEFSPAEHQPTVGLRDSKDRTGPVLEFGHHDWVAFTEGVKGDKLG